MFSSGDLSSDLKPLDNVWFQIIHKLKKNKHFQSIAQLFKTSNIKWNKVDLSFRKRLSASLTITNRKKRYFILFNSSLFPCQYFLLGK